MLRALYMKWLKFHNFDKWWNLYSYDKYCKNCQVKSKDGCVIDYLTGKCIDV